MKYDLVKVEEEAPGNVIITFKRQFRPNWFQRLLGRKPKDELVRFIGFNKHWWDLSYGKRVPPVIWDRCNQIYRRYQNEQVANGK